MANIDKALSTTTANVSDLAASSLDPLQFISQSTSSIKLNRGHGKSKAAVAALNGQLDSVLSTIRSAQQQRFAELETCARKALSDLPELSTDINVISLQQALLPSIVAKFKEQVLSLSTLLEASSSANNPAIMQLQDILLARRNIRKAIQMVEKEQTYKDAVKDLENELKIKDLDRATSLLESLNELIVNDDDVRQDSEKLKMRDSLRDRLIQLIKDS